MTATDVIARTDRVFKLMGPTTGRMQNDFLDPLLKRTFGILMRAKKFPPIPQVIKDAQAEMDIEYTGPMPRAQRQDLITAVNNWVGMTAQIAEINPEVMDIPDWDAISRETARLAGIPTRLTVGEEKVKADRRKRQKAQQAAQEAEQAKAEGEATEAVGKGEQALQAVGGQQQ